MPLAFLNLGPSELAILLILFLVLFGIDKAPQMARSLGRAKAELTRAESQVREALETEDEREARELTAFEREREAVIRREGQPARQALVLQAMQLGFDPDGMSDDELRAAIAARSGKDGGADAGTQKAQENAADARQ